MFEKIYCTHHNYYLKLLLVKYKIKITFNFYMIDIDKIKFKI